MKRFILAALTLIAGTAFAGTETQILTYPTKIELVYDSDRDTSAGKARVVEIDGAAANGTVAGGTGDGVAIVRGDLIVTGAVRPILTETFGEGASGKGIYTVQMDGTVTDGATGVLNVLYTGSGNKFMFASLGAGQTILPVMAAGGLDISGDAADDEGYEIIGGGMFEASGVPFVIGTSPAFYFCVTATFADISDTDDWHVGFRAMELTNAAYNDYTDYFSIGTVGEANPATIFVEEEIGGASAASTDTTLTVADATAAKYCVYVSAAGVATATLDDVLITASGVSYTFADGLMVVPHIWSLHGTASSMGCVINEWEVGYTELKPLGS